MITVSQSSLKKKSLQCLTYMMGKILMHNVNLQMQSFRRSSSFTLPDGWEIEEKPRNNYSGHIDKVPVLLKIFGGFPPLVLERVYAALYLFIILAFCSLGVIIAQMHASGLTCMCTVHFAYTVQMLSSRLQS